jgi:Tol biopolymer transport system component
VKYEARANSRRFAGRSSRTVNRLGVSLRIGSGAVLLAAAVAAQTVTLVTQGVSGQADAGSLYAEISADGRWIAYQSAATNLVPGDTNGAPDVFLHDRATGTTIRVSVDSAGNQGDDDSLEPALSLDGRFVAFFAYATNLVPGDANGKPDIFVRDVVAGTTVRASVGPGGIESDGGSRYPSISADGRYVAFESQGTNLVPSDTNGVRDLFVRDLVSGTTVRASESVGGVEGDGDSTDASISPDGRYVAFESLASNLVPGDTNGTSDVFVKDLLTGAIVRASVDSSGAEGNETSRDPWISDLGLFVSFSSEASNLVPNDGNGYEDLFVHDLTTGGTVRASVSTAGMQAHIGAYDGTLSADGRYLAFFSRASNLVPGDTNSSIDIFVRDLQASTTERISLGSLGQPSNGHSYYPAITPGGRYVAFDSFADNLVLGDANGIRDIFLYDRYSPFRPFCAGDGSIATFCPCGNGGMPGHGCQNSGSTGGATLLASGDTNPDTVRLDTTGERPTALSIFLQGNANTSTGVVFGDGVRCVSGTLKRLYVKSASGGACSAPGIGDPSITARSAALGDPISPGDTRYYQVYYRDPTAGFCPPETFNATNGSRIGW